MDFNISTKPTDDYIVLTLNLVDSKHHIKHKAILTA